MQSKQLVSTALALAAAMGLVTQAAANDKTAKEKCYGISKAGANDCASLSGSHSCAGQARVDNAPDEWRYVAKGTCKTLGGMTAEEAKVKMKR